MRGEVIAEDGEKPRQHRDVLANLLTTTAGPVCIASPYVTNNELVQGLEKHKPGVRLLTSLAPRDIVCSATSLACIKSLIQAGVACRSVSGMNLHAKVYLFGSESAVITSANFTDKGLSRNLEVGVRLTDASVQEVASWFDGLWKKAKPISVREVNQLDDETKDLRRQFAAAKEGNATTKCPVETNPSVRSADDLRELLKEGRLMFVCNTNRRWSPDRGDEHLMRHTHYATVWTEFRWEKHIRSVKKGDAILMYAKGVGIIGIGQAKGGVEILRAGDPGKIRPDKKDQEEWRVPVEDWLMWVEDNDADAYDDWTMGNTSFLNVSGDRYSDLRRDLRKHFLVDS